MPSVPNIHIKIHEDTTFMKELKCYKCEKVYKDPWKLLRYDWRAHRTIECKIWVVEKSRIKTTQRAETSNVQKDSMHIFPGL